MPSFRFSLVVAALAAAYALSVYAYTSLPLDEWFPDDFTATLQTIGECTKEENGTMCARPAVIALLDVHSGEEITRAIDERFTPQQCHYLGHVIGQESYNKFKDVETAIGQCGRDCDSACIHGVIGESFAEQLGLGSSDDVRDVDLAHLDPVQMKTIGTQLCASPTACHGVGHALFQLYHDFVPALAMCREVSSDGRPNFCYQGAFMEYADILSARNARPIDGVHYPTVTSLPDFCTGYRSTPEKRSCYRYFPRIVAQTHMREGMPAAEAREQALSICTSYQELQDRVGCLAGYGVYSAYNIITDRARAIRICGQFESMADRAACTVGIVSVASEERQGLIVAYCREIPDESLRADCYQAVFFYLNRLGVPRETSRELCTADALCLDGAAQFADDAWQRVIDRYGR